MWQMIKFGESLLHLHEQTTPVEENSAVVEKSKALLETFIHRHTLLQRKKSKKTSSEYIKR